MPRLLWLSVLLAVAAADAQEQERPRLGREDLLAALSSCPEPLLRKRGERLGCRPLKIANLAHDMVDVAQWGA